MELAPLLLVVLLAAGVAGVSFVIVQRTRALLTRIDTDAETIRTLADCVESAIVRQSVALQYHLMASDPLHRSENVRARALEDSALAHLEVEIGKTGPAGMTALNDTRLLLRRWHRTPGRAAERRD